MAVGPALLELGDCSSQSTSNKELVLMLILMENME